MIQNVNLKNLEKKVASNSDLHIDEFSIHRAEWSDGTFELIFEASGCDLFKIYLTRMDKEQVPIATKFGLMLDVDYLPHTSSYYEEEIELFITIVLEYLYEHS